MEPEVDNYRCYICLKGEKRGSEFYDPQCGCKGSLKIHRSCMRETMMTRGSCECPVCKRTMIDYCDWSGRRVVYERVADSVVAKYRVRDDNRAKQGMYEEYDVGSGDMIRQVEYDNGKMHGECMWWCSGGGLRMQGSYVYGKKHGAWYEFEESGEYTEIIYYYDELIEYSRYNSRQEKVDYEYYGMESMRRLGAELATELSAEFVY
jgi:hypothetical protein